MEFDSKEDIEAPIEEVFAMLCEFDTFERLALRRGVEVVRKADVPGGGAGMAWAAQFDLRGKARSLDLELVRFDRPDRMEFDARSGGLDGKMVFTLVALSPRRTRLSADLTLIPRNLSARLLVQSLKLARANLTRKFKLGMANYAKSLEERYRQTV
ncbi:MAG: hypothetical protein CML02_08355 [Pseudooceanicola sp.]|jgi:hypothetical protein|nr:hypothetical protein [Pseudooceanicola sp.]|tara:strand:- start:695 stop:1162 length:468 start_codon:yes stop_codon:yes gene_type:complete